MSGKKIELLNLSDHFEKCQADRATDWNLYFLCRGVNLTALVCPANVTKADGNQRYRAVLENLKRCDEIGQLPSSLKRRFQNPNLLADCVQFQAKFHQSYRNYSRGCKRRHTNEGSQQQSSTANLKVRSQHIADNFQLRCIHVTRLIPTKTSTMHTHTLG